MVPLRAVQMGQDGEFAYVVGKDMKAEMRPVVTGLRLEDEVVVEKGLQSGETVVTEGQLRVGPGHEGARPKGEDEASMNLSELFIRRPVATSLLMLAIALFGFVAYRALPVSDLPNVDFPTISVSASLPGASPETMASSVATPLEKQFSTIAGRGPDDLVRAASAARRSRCSSRWTAIWTGPRWTCSPASHALRGRCRRGCRARLRSARSIPADMPIFFLTLTSDTLPLYELNEYADTMMGQRISMVSGVAQVQIMGSANRAVRIQVDPTGAGRQGHRHR